MFEKRLFSLVPQATPYIMASVLFKWIALMANITVMWMLARILGGIVTDGLSAAILLGMSANVLFVLSKEEGQPRRGSAVVGLILGVMSTIFGVVEFFCLIQVYHMITDPQYAPFFDQAMELYESLIGPLQ